MQKPIRLDNPTDPKLIAQFDRAQIDAHVLEQIARLERARAIGEALASAIAWLVRLPRRIVENRPARRHAGSTVG
jgi:hypothetical protein